MITDESIYQRYLDGEGNAADLLVERYGDMLTLYINGYIKDIHEAEDLMIEVFSKIFAKERPINEISGAVCASCPCCTGIFCVKIASPDGIDGIKGHRILQ